MKKQKIFPAVLFVVGFAIIIANAVDYLGGFFGLTWEYHLPSSAIGVVFLVVGMYQLRLFEGAKTAENKKT
jgi:hypothetical protein